LTPARGQPWSSCLRNTTLTASERPAEDVTDYRLFRDFGMNSVRTLSAHSAASPFQLGLVSEGTCPSFRQRLQTSRLGVGKTYPCRCCRHNTLTMRGQFDICPLCSWEDDGPDNHDAEEVRGGPNGILSLSEARQNFAAFGACQERFLKLVRPAEEGEWGPA
jgi:hypothetical protein